MKLFNIILVLLVVSGCKNSNTSDKDNNTSEDELSNTIKVIGAVKAQQEQEAIDAMEDTKAMETLDWQGTYFGITDCANCDGIETELVLKDNEYILSLKPTNTDEEKFVQKGKFTWKGSIIVLEDIIGSASMYKIEENQVKQVYYIDNKIQGEDWKGYILKKTTK